MSLSSTLRYFYRTVASAFMLAAAFAHGQTQATVQGGITVDGKKTEFRHAVAVTQLAASNGKPETVLVVTDQPLTEARAASRAERKLARERDGIKMLEVALDKRPDDSVWVYISVDPIRADSSTRRHKLQLDAAGDKRVKGRLSMDSPWEMFGNRYQIDLRFDAPLVMGN
jgi:hypothetical protein